MSDERTKPETDAARETTEKRDQVTDLAPDAGKQADEKVKGGRQQFDGERGVRM